MEATLQGLPLVTPCPQRLPLAQASAGVVEAHNRDIAEGAVRDASGAVVRQPVDGLLLATDGRAYPIRGGIAVLFAEAAMQTSITPRRPA